MESIIEVIGDSSLNLLPAAKPLDEELIKQIENTISKIGPHDIVDLNEFPPQY